MAEESHSAASTQQLDEPEYKTWRPDDVLAALRLQQIQTEQAQFNRDSTTESLTLQQGIVNALRSGTAAGSLEGADATLLAYLQSAVVGTAGLPGSLRHGALELSLIKTGLLAPFVPDFDLDKRKLSIGVPTNADALCDNLSELVRVAASALACRWAYANYKHSEDSIPADDAGLYFTTLCIRSLSVPEVCETFDARAAELSAMAQQQGTFAAVAAGGSGEAVPGAGDSPVPAKISLTSKQLRWLMHVVRAELCGWFADVQMLLRDQRFEESLVAQQQDWLTAIKQAPDYVNAYVQYVRSCLRFQQARPAYIFADKGLVVAQKWHDDIARSQLLCLKAVAEAMGGHGQPTFTPASLAAALSESRAAAASVREWLPPQFHDLLEPPREADMIWRTILRVAAAGREALVAAAEGGVPQVLLGTPQDEDPSADEGPVAWDGGEAEAAAIANAGSDPIPVLPLVFTMPQPHRLPMGALTQLMAAQQSALTGEASGGSPGGKSGARRGASARSKGAGAKAKASPKK